MVAGVNLHSLGQSLNFVFFSTNGLAHQSQCYHTDAHSFCFTGGISAPLWPFHPTQVSKPLGATLAAVLQYLTEDMQQNVTSGRGHWSSIYNWTHGGNSQMMNMNTDSLCVNIHLSVSDCVWTRGVVSSLHGASAQEFRWELAAPAKLAVFSSNQWEMINHAVAPPSPGYQI